MSLGCAHLVLIFCLSLTSALEWSSFRREYGTLDVMDVSEERFRNAHVPIQYSPIYGIKCLDDGCVARQFLTVRQGNEHIVEFSNYWTTKSKLNDKGLYTSCPKNMLTMGMARKYSWSLDQMMCGRVDQRFKILAKKNVLVETAKNNIVLCPNGMYVQGIQCLERQCDKIGLFCVELSFNKILESKYPLVPNGNRVIINDFFNATTNGGLSEKMDGPIFRIGRFDKCVGTRHFTIGRGLKPILGPVKKWTEIASNEGTSVSCPRGMLVSQMKCGGKCCDEISLGCSELVNKKVFEIDETQVTVSNLFGTDIVGGFCPDGHYAKGINCFRTNCNLIIIECVKMTFIE